MFGAFKKLLKDQWPTFVREAFANHPAKATLFIARALTARVQMRFEPRRTAMSGLHLRPVSAARDYLRYYGELEAGLQKLNWQGGGYKLIEDKVITAESLTAAGVATAPIIAIIGRNESDHPYSGTIPNISSREAVIKMLNSAPAELIVKPAGGDRGKDVLGATRRGDVWELNGVRTSVEKLADRLVANAGPLGWLVQPRLKSHPGMAAIGGDLGLSTVRINTALLKTGPTVLFAFVKLMGGPGVVDNFHGGKYGNLLASVDTASGAIIKAFGRRPGQRHFIEPVTQHPITHVPLAGFQLPLWAETKALALRCAASCTESPLLGADTAITDAGPSIIEINADWDANVPQLLTGRGLRPILRDIWIDLAAPAELKSEVQHLLGL